MAAAAPGFSSGQAVAAMQRAAADRAAARFRLRVDRHHLPGAQGRLDRQSVIFGLAIVFVFLILAAQYESWSMPFMVLLAVPLALFGALGALWLRGLQIDVYSQIGFVMLIGLAAKNAILIVEFARTRREEGHSIVDSAMEAARLRLRPILMTAFAFILGVLPLMFATGAGAASRQSIGTTVFGGMAAATILTLLFVPVFYAVIERLREGRDGARQGRCRSPMPGSTTRRGRQNRHGASHHADQNASCSAATAIVVAVAGGRLLDIAGPARGHGGAQAAQHGAGRRRLSGAGGARRAKNHPALPRLSGAHGVDPRRQPAGEGVGLSCSSSRSPMAPMSSQGTLLYQLDPRDFQAALDQANAQAERDIAALDYARANFGRGDQLAKERLARQGHLRPAREHDAPGCECAGDGPCAAIRAGAAQPGLQPRSGHPSPAASAATRRRSERSSASAARC